LADIKTSQSYYLEAIDFLNTSYLIKPSLSVLKKIADNYYSLENYEKAIDYIYQALDIHKNHPKYLDKLLELFIKTKNLVRAREVYENLFLNNPENNKLEEWQEKIEKLEIDKEKK
jgi:tetratricopeptide (TPR) repeat protein